MTGRVCVVGSLNIDLVTQVSAHPAPGQITRGTGLRRLPGGKGANQALAAARAGACTRLVGHIGEDGTDCRRALVEQGVDCSAVTVTSGTPTGHALIAVDENGKNTIIVIPGANESLTVERIQPYRDLIRTADVLLLQLEIPVSTVRHAALLAADAGRRVILNPSPWVDLPADLLAVADPLIVNEHEAEQMPSDTVRSLCVTMGERGAQWGEITVPAPPMEVVDTTGAGDAFAGTLAAALSFGVPKKEALQTAVEAASAACAQPGAQGCALP